MPRVAVVTGAGVRIGRAIALGLAEAGYDVVVHHLGSEEGAADTVDRIRGLGRQAVAIRADLSVEEEVRLLAEDVRVRFGRVDLLVNSASNFRRRKLEEVDGPEWDHVMGVNLKGPFMTVQALRPLLSGCGGNVVNIVDLSAFQPWVDYPHHAVSKAALLHLTRVQARALAPRIRVNAVAPGAVLPPEGTDAWELERSRQRTPLETIGSPEDVVRTVLFLARSPFVTGEVVVVDGGRLLNPG